MVDEGRLIICLDSKGNNKPYSRGGYGGFVYLKFLIGGCSKVVFYPSTRLIIITYEAQI
jgi:hypothetical protein